MTILCLQSIMVGKRLTQDDVIKHLDDPNATSVCFVSQEREDFLVLFERFLVHFQRKRIVFQFYQRRKRMTIPQIQRIHLVLHHHIQILHPLLFVVEPREVLWRVGIFIDCMPRQIDRLLKSDARATHHHLWRLVCNRCSQTALITSRFDVSIVTSHLKSAITKSVHQFNSSIDDTAWIVAHHIIAAAIV